MSSKPPEFDEKARNLAARIRSLTKANDDDSRGGSHRADSQALRLVSDFSAATLVGCGLGYGVDAWLESGPWGLIIGLFIGVAAGTRRMLMQEK